MGDFTIRAIGDRGFLIQAEPVIDVEINRMIHSLSHLIAEQSWPGIIEMVPGYADLLVCYEPVEISYRDLYRNLEGILEEIREIPTAKSRHHRIPVCYSSQYGQDLKQVADQANCTEQEVIDIHCQGLYHVYMLGFTPGFPYLGGMDPAIACPRKQSPRTHIPAGSVGIAEGQTGIYPIDSPGGWQIIGRTPLRLFNPEGDQPFLFQPGDELQFYPISEQEFTNYLPDGSH